MNIGEISADQYSKDGVKYSINKSNNELVKQIIKVTYKMIIFMLLVVNLEKASLSLCI